MVLQRGLLADADYVYLQSGPAAPAILKSVEPKVGQTVGQAMDLQERLYSQGHAGRVGCDVFGPSHAY